MKLAVLDYGIGNLRSAQKAFEHVGADARLTADLAEIEAADAVVLPGVGAFGACVDALESTGIGQVALDAVASGRPFIGICVGMQLLFAGSEETPGAKGLGVFDSTITLLPDTVKRPQMQWNRLIATDAAHPMFADLAEPWVYFVHSYFATVSAETIGTCEYGATVSAAVARDNVWATQFHPEKSATAGLQILSNFLRWAALPDSQRTRGA
ncbi:MAG: imidazole glycerol phosphate synthase subunit HisH [Actinobacteria bacterium]|nr:imidazole glycerol phosphate synthase subunit HisH [Actinomycetota bacterium]